MNGTLLVAEDHQSARELIATALEGEGYDLVFAESGTKAAGLVGETHVDAALLDVSLPGLSGQEICRRIKEKDRSTPVILISGALGARELAEQGEAAGADACIAKPFSLDELRTVLRAFTRVREQAGEIGELRARLQRLDAERAARADSALPALDFSLPYHEFTRAARKAYFVHALAATGGNKSRMARESGLDRSTLYVHLRNLGMLPEGKK
jgi:DNA-binding response OmpR family regulator